jgi:hypothetical protein
MRGFISCFNKYQYGDQIQGDKMGTRACSMHGRLEKCIQNFTRFKVFMVRKIKVMAFEFLKLYSDVV